MTHVDALSRYTRSLREEFKYEPIVTVDEDEHRNQLVVGIDSGEINFRLQISQNRDDRIVKLKEKLENGPVKDFILDDGIVYRQSKDTELLYVPKEMETN